MFTAADFQLYGPRFQSDPEWNGRRLEVRRRLQALGDGIKESFAALGLSLDRRESLHHPHASNGRQVRRQRTMLFRDKRARRALQQFLGRDLGRDLDSAVNNVHLQAGLEERGAYWGLRVDPGAWYDLNVLLKRAESSSGRAEILAACRGAAAFTLEVDRGGARPLGEMSDRDWRDLAGTIQPGQSALDVIRRMLAEQVAEAGGDFDGAVVSDLATLAPLFRLCSWTLDESCPSGASL